MKSLTEYLTFHIPERMAFKNITQQVADVGGITAPDPHATGIAVDQVPAFVPRLIQGVRAAVRTGAGKAYASANVDSCAFYVRLPAAGSRCHGDRCTRSQRCLRLLPSVCSDRCA